MTSVRVYLSRSSRSCLDSAPPPGVPRGSRHDRQYRGYFAGPSGVVPVRVRLVGCRPAAAGAGRSAGYELQLVGGARQRRGAQAAARLCRQAAAVAVATVALSGAAEARSLEMSMAVPVPPGVHRNDTRLRASTAAPFMGLRAEKRSRSVTPLVDERGMPVMLGAFHSNSTGVGTHLNSLTPHTNTPTWSNHSNTAHPGRSVYPWTNHANLPANTIQHANVTPNDFIF